MGGGQSRSVEIQISNKTRNFTLEKPRTYFNCGLCSKPPNPFLPPGSGDSCYFLGNSPSQGVAGVLAYEAESFSLVIHFSNRLDYNLSHMQLGLELSLNKAHLNDLEETYTRMAQGRSSKSWWTKSNHFILTDSRGTAEVTNGSFRMTNGPAKVTNGTAKVTNGPVKVTATMSNTENAAIRVVLEEQGALMERAR